jgi:Flp pilus assembly protein TadG
MTDSRRLSNRHHSDRGQGLTEFAIVLPLILLSICAILDLGRAVYAYSTIGNAARAGSRVAIVDQNVSVVRSKAVEQAVALGISPSAVAVSYRTSDLAGPCSPVALGCVAEITVPYAFTAVTPIISTIVGPISLSSTTRFPVERIYASP